MKSIKSNMTSNSRFGILTSAFFLVTLLAACGPVDNPQPEDNGNPDAGETDNGGDNNGGGENNGDGTGGENGGDPTVLESPKDFTLTTGGIKTFQFNWTDTENATYYKLLENIDGQSGFDVIRDNIPQGEEAIQIETSLHRSMFGQYMLQACIESSCSGFSDIAFVKDNADELNKAVGFIKASNAQAQDRFGGLLKGDNSSSAAMSLSADGQTLVVGAPGEDSGSNSIIGAVESDNSRSASGAVYVFSKSDTGWIQQAYIKARNADADDNFGNAVSVSADGNILVVGSTHEDSNGQSVDPSDIEEQNNSAGNSGAVYVFTRDSDQWSQASFIKSSNSGSGDQFGQAVSISADGLRMVVGAFGEDSNTTGVSTVSATDNNAGNSGAAYVFDFVDGSWVEKAYIKASNNQGDDMFGANVRISADGNTIAVSAQFEDSNAIVVDGDGTNNSNGDSGAVYVFAIEGEQWAQQAYIKASNAGVNDFFGSSIDVSGDGNTLVVGARGENSGNLNESDNSQADSGAVYVYVRNGAAWSKQAYVKANTVGASDSFGRAVSISDDGNMIAVSANGEDSSSPFLREVEDNNGLSASGAAYVFGRVGDTWVQSSFLKASNPGVQDQFGRALDLSEDGSTLAVGTDFDDNGATGINGDQTIKGAIESGVVYLY